MGYLRIRLMELTKHGNNAEIKVHILSDEEMRDIGFTDHAKTRWYFCRNAGLAGISFNVTINKDMSDWRIDILDDAFCQPYDYQYILERNPQSEAAKKVQARVESLMADLTEKGIISGHKYGEYI